MKTAMQELIEELQKMYYDVNFPNSAKEGLIIAISTACNQLKSLDKEREQIVDAFDNGQANWDPKCRDYDNGNHYYNSL